VIGRSKDQTNWFYFTDHPMADHPIRLYAFIVK